MIGARLEEYRVKKGYKVEELALIIGIEQGTLSKIKLGKTQPHAKTIEKIIRNTDINAHWLATGEGEMLRSEPPLKEIDTCSPRNEEERQIIAKVLHVIRGKWEDEYEISLRKNIDTLYKGALREERERQRRSGATVDAEAEQKGRASEYIENGLPRRKTKG